MRLTLAVAYRSGVHLSYALDAASPWEGYEVAFNGTRGRLEHRCRETVYVSGDGREADGERREHSGATSGGQSGGRHNSS